MKKMLLSILLIVMMMSNTIIATVCLAEETEKEITEEKTVETQADSTEPTVEWYLPTKFKLGESVDEILKKINGDGQTGRRVAQVSNIPEGYDTGTLGGSFGYYYSETIPYYIPHSGGGGPGGGVVTLNALTLTTPGEYKAIAMIGDGIEEESDKRAVGEPLDITVEEPVITSNAPEKIEIGTSLDFKSELTNVAIENEKVAIYDDENNWDRSYGYSMFHGEDPMGGYMHPIAYRPTIEVISGKDLIAQENTDATNTLNISEKITFNKAGTVELKVKYNQIDVCTLCTGGNEGFAPTLLYNPEKTIKINVVDSSASEETPSGDGTTGDNTSSEEKPLATTTVKGRLVDINGNPLSNVVVAMFSNPIWTLTDNNGNYVLENVPVGNHTIRVFNTKEDFDSYCNDLKNGITPTVKPLAELKDVNIIQDINGVITISFDGKNYSVNDVIKATVTSSGKIIVSKTDIPKTSDESAIIIFSLMALASVTAIAILLTLKNKRKCN